MIQKGKTNKRQRFLKNFFLGSAKPGAALPSICLEGRGIRPGVSNTS